MTVYKVLLTLISSFILKTTISSNPAYSDYLLGLNFWSSNTYFLLLFVGLLTVLINGKVFYVILIVIVELISCTYFYINTYNCLYTHMSTLWIGTIVCHPYLLYISISVFISFFFDYTSNLKLSTIPLFYIISLSFFTLFLGGLWGTQSITWGYFWVNDTIEWILLLVCFSFLIIHHSNQLKKKLLFVNIIFFINLYMLVYVRLNIIDTRHNFINLYWLNCMYQYIYLFIYFINCSLLMYTRFYSYVAFILLFVNKLYYLSNVLGFFIIISLVHLYKYSIYIYRYTNLKLHIYIYIFYIIWLTYITNFVIFYKLIYNILNSYIIWFKQYTINFQQFKYQLDTAFLEKINTINIFKAQILTYLTNYTSYFVTFGGSTYLLFIFFYIFKFLYKK